MSSSQQQKQRVQVYLIRHGYSIANRFTTKEKQDISSQTFMNFIMTKKNLLQKIAEPDPSLTRTGIQQSKKAFTFVSNLNPDYVFTSVLCRAQQTALFMFPSVPKVIVAPFLKEKNNKIDPVLPFSDNKPFRDIFTQYEKRHNVLSKKDLDRLYYSKEVLSSSTTIQQQWQQQQTQQEQFQVVNVKTVSQCLYKDEAINESGNINNFLTHYLFPLLSAQSPLPNKTIKVIVVCHGELIKEFLKIQHVQNNATYVVSFDNLFKLKNMVYSNVEILFDGFENVKISCQSHHVITTDENLIHFAYPYQMIQSKRNLTLKQLQQIFVQQSLKNDTSFGDRQRRINNLVQVIRKPEKSSSAILHKFLQKYPEVRSYSTPDAVKTFLQKHPQQLNMLMYDPAHQFQQLIHNIKQAHQLSSQKQVVNFINQRLTDVDKTPQTIFTQLLKMLL